MRLLLVSVAASTTRLAKGCAASTERWDPSKASFVAITGAVILFVELLTLAYFIVAFLSCTAICYLSFLYEVVRYITQIGTHFYTFSKAVATLNGEARAICLLQGNISQEMIIT